MSLFFVLPKMILQSKRSIPLKHFFVFHILLLLSLKAKAKCKSGCKLALASYYVWEGSNLTYISKIFDQQISEILRYNPQVPNQDSIFSGTRIKVPFSCDCLDKDFMGHTFTYTTQHGNTYSKIARIAFANLTTEDWVQRVNVYEPTKVPNNVPINVTVNCSCGNKHISKDYGLFLTYPLQPGDNLSSLATEAVVPAELVEMYNKGCNFSSGVGIVFVPARGSGSTSEKTSESVALVGSASEITVDKSVEFSYEELAKATNDFNYSCKIGQGGFGSVYYAELRGEEVAIKKMDMQASKEFLAELKVLTHVHHLNLVRLIGYCVQGSLFLVYEYIENGNLSQYLRCSGNMEPLPWSTRVQIALDSARGLEYIHEHTVPVYIHGDVKSANILIDKNHRAKVADFGLAKLNEYAGASLHTRLVGTFGYMSPEYAQYGDVSPKVDVYAFGVVLYELISAKQAVVKTNELCVTESKGLVSLFEDVFNTQPDIKENLSKIVDPRLGNNYSIDSIYKMAQLAKACTYENPELRPSTRSIVVALMTLSSTNQEEWDVGSFYENQSLFNPVSGR